MVVLVIEGKSGSATCEGAIVPIIYRFEMPGGLGIVVDVVNPTDAHEGYPFCFGLNGVERGKACIDAISQLELLAAQQVLC
jgi:hypothetical protein